MHYDDKIETRLRDDKEKRKRSLSSKNCEELTNKHTRVSPIQMGPLMVKFYHKPMGKFYHKSYGKILTPPGGRFSGKKEKKLEENTRIYSLE